MRGSVKKDTVNMDLHESASPVPSWEDGNYTPIEILSWMGDSSQSFEDTEEVRENFISKCLSNLSALRTEQGSLCKSFQSTSSDPFETAAALSFCTEKLEMLNRHHPPEHNELVGDESAENDLEGFKWKAEKLKIENLIVDLKKQNHSRNNSSESCKKHRKKREKVKTQDFLRRKLQIIEDAEVKQRYHKHLTERTSAMLIGDIVKDSVNPTASRDEVWKQFMKNHQHTL